MRISDWSSDVCSSDLDFNPFNLIVADRERAQFLSNRPETARSRLAHGIYGLSNGALDEPWPKTMRLKALLLDWIVKAATPPEALLAGLRAEDLDRQSVGQGTRVSVRVATWGRR